MTAWISVPIYGLAAALLVIAGLLNTRNARFFYGAAVVMATQGIAVPIVFKFVTDAC